MSEFRILGSITKAYQGDDKKLYVSGLASGTQIDREGERMASSAIDAFKRAIDDGIVSYDGTWSLVPLRSGHRYEWDDVLGWITEASIDNEYNLVITAELDQDNPQALNLYKKLTRPPEEGKAVRLGFSVGGMVIAAGEEYDAELGKTVYVYRDVALKETSVTSMPAYAPSYITALQKSVDWSKVSGHRTELTKAANWMVHAATDLEIWHDDTWDGDIAADSIFEYAGWPDSPDPEVAMKGFLAHDEANEDMKAAFKLPFAMVRLCPECGEKELFASASGLEAASSMLPQADLPDGVKTDARAVIAAYMQRMEDEEAYYGDDSSDDESSDDEDVQKAASDGFKPTQRMATVAKRALEWRDEFNRGGTAVGVARARDISNRKSLSLSTVKRMNSFFARHEVDKKAKGFREGEEGFPSAGRIAWDLWGGDPGRAWASKIVKGQKSMTKGRLRNDLAKSETPIVEEEEVAKTDSTITPVATEEAVEKAVTEETAPVAVEAAVEAAVEENVAPEEVEKSTDPQAGHETLAAVTKAVIELAETVADLKAQIANANPVEAVAKSEEQVTTDAPANEAAPEAEGNIAMVETAVVDDLVKAMQIAVAAAVAPLERRIAELEEQPVDKSIAVSKIADKVVEVDPVTAFRQHVEKHNLVGSDAIRSALDAAFGR